MKQQSFEDKVRDLVYHHEEAAPNVMDKVFEKRTPWYVLRNKLSLYKYRIAAAVAVIAGILMLINPFGKPTTSENVNTPVVAEQPINQTTTSTNENSTQGEVTTNNEQIDDHLTDDNTVNNVATGDAQEVDDNSVVIVENQPNNTPQTIGSEAEGSSPSNPAETNPAQDENPTPEVVTTNSGDDGSTEPGSDTDQPGVEDDQSNDADNTEIAQKDGDNQDKAPETEDDQQNADADIAQADDTKSDQANDVNDDQDMMGTAPATPVRKWSVAMSYGPSTGNRRFDNVGESSLINARNDAEKALYSNTAEVTLNYSISPNIDAYLGVNYFNRRERMNYVEMHTTSSTEVTSRQVIEYHPVYGPRTITVYDTVTNHVTVENNVTSLNNYNHFVVPLGFRYTLYLNKNLGIFINGSAGLEFMTRANGQVLGANNQLTDLSGFGRTQFGASLSGGAGAAVRLNDRMTALFEPRATFYLSPTNNQDYTLNQWDQGYGFMIGLKYGL